LSSKLSAFRPSPSFKNSADAEARSRISALEEGDLQQERWLAALEAKQSQLAQLPAKLARMQRQLCREVERLQSEISGLQALAAEDVCLREVEAMRQETKADVAALRSEICQVRKAADAAERLAHETQKHSPEAPQKQPALCRSATFVICWS
jgi:chromosome segregation ATPase